MRKFALVFVALVSFVAPASAASKEDVAEVAAMVTDKKVPVLFRTKHIYAGDNSNQGSTIVFVYNGLRYTIYNSGDRVREDNPNSAWLWITVRKDGTSDARSLYSMTDEGLDGVVEAGNRGRSEQIYQIKGYIHDEPKGDEYASFWQMRYDGAIKAALAHKRSKQK